MSLIADDPTPTTGGPVDAWWEDRPDGCVCYVREDVEYGDVWTRPAGGCPVHVESWRPATEEADLASAKVATDLLGPALGPDAGPGADYSFVFDPDQPDGAR